jgi:predicted nuclease of restriction endonuclease-like RecB superfamily
MLTNEHAIIEYKDGRVIPDRLTRNTHRHYVDHAERMLAIYCEGIGRQRRWLHGDIERVFADEPDCPVRRIQAFCKLLDDASTFGGDPSGKSAKLRLDVFSRAARHHPLVRQPDRLFEHEEEATKARIADELGTSSEQIDQALYADVMAYQTLEEFTGYPGPGAFLSRYNVAQLQASLYRAESMTVTAGDDLKTIVRYAKFARLLHEIVRVGSSTYRITFTGPASVLRETRRYGVDFAKFLPALLACKGWTMEAILQTPWKAHAKLVISAEDGFTSHLPAVQEFDSALEASFAEKFGPHRNGWQLIREGRILCDHQKTFVPDFTLRHEDGTEVLLEIVGFWTPEYLAAKRETLRLFRRHHILLAVPERSLREGAVVGENVLTYKTTIKLPPLLAALEAARAVAR